MLSIVQTISLIGLNGNLVEVQTDITGGLPNFEIVGLPDIAVRESKERIKSAIKNSGVELNSRKILINLAPSDIKKEGSGYDLPIAIGILLAIGAIKNFNTKSVIFIGELALDGKINKVPGILPVCIEAKKNKIKIVFVPKENEKEATIIEGLQIVAVANLIEVMEFINQNKEVGETKKNINFEDENFKVSEIDIAAAGWHNCILTGSPGGGKTMLAKRLPTILPKLTFEEALEITKIHSIAGTLKSDTGIITTRPFRTPHHTISTTSMVGGGRIPKPRRNKFGTLWCFVFR